MSKLKNNSEEKFPSSYLINTRQENNILKLADNFHRQFKYLYPERIKPPLYLENESKVNKLVSTTLCPFKVTMPTVLRRWQYCANFFSEYFDYEPLSPPTNGPENLPSVETILKKRTGNSLEISSVLCTFLLASNYDAYVVQGYAKRNICEKQENKEASPPIQFDTDSEYHKRYFTEKEMQEDVKSRNKYELNFDQLKSFWFEGKSVFQPDEVRKVEPGVEDVETDIYLGRRIHFWILVSVYKSGGVESFFLEPTTGEKKSIGDSDYLGIEFVWNNKNFWCNNQKFDGKCKNLKFDFENCALWEAFLPDYSITDDNENLLRMPETWVRDVEVSQDDLQNRLPKNGREFHFKTSKVLKYNPGASKDGLIYHITYYKSIEKEQPIESHSFFSKRKDFLEYRKTDFSKELVKDVFALGRSDSLEEHEYPQKGIGSFPQKLQFYAHLRKDHLASRIWTDSTTHNNFVDRSDLLVCRKVYYFQKDSHKDKDIPESEKAFEINTESIENLSNIDDESEIMNSQNEIQPTESTLSYSKQDDIDTVASKEGLENTEIKQAIYFEAEIVGEEAKSDTELVGIGPSSFGAENILFEDSDFSQWKFGEFLNSLDPAERYATSESESEEEMDRITEKRRRKEGTENSETIRDLNDKRDDTAEEAPQSSKVEISNSEEKGRKIQNGEDTVPEHLNGQKVSQEEEPLKKELDDKDAGKKSTDEAIIAERYAKSKSEEEMNSMTEKERKEGKKSSETTLDLKDKREGTAEQTPQSHTKGEISKTEEKYRTIQNGEDPVPEHLNGQNVKREEAALEKVPDDKDTEKGSTDEAIITDKKKTDESVHEVITDREVIYKNSNDKDQHSEPEMEEKSEGELDIEMDIYDEINFDDLSDEELETDYQLFLSKLWEKYNTISDEELFYMTQEFQNHKDLRSRHILKLKKRIIKKRRKNVRYLQRIQLGKPVVRIYKRKTEDIQNREEGIYTNNIIDFLELKRILKIDSASDIKEFHEIEPLEESYIDAVNAEIMKKEGMRLLDKKLKDNKIKRHFNKFRCIQDCYLKDPSIPVEHAIENVYFDFETGGYRLDFHYPRDSCSRKILLFTKPESGNTDFTFSDILCQQILPSYETKQIKASQLYSYLVTLIKKEPLVVREYERFDGEMKDILHTRIAEENIIFQETNEGNYGKEDRSKMIDKSHETKTIT